MMNKNYILHFIELGVIAVLMIVVVSPKLFTDETQQLSVPPVGNIETKEDVYDDLQQLGCEIIHVRDEYSTHRFSANLTEFRKIAYKTKVVFVELVRGDGWIGGYDINEGVAMYTVYEGTIVETAIEVELD